jgi:hypothetical protein
VACGYAAHVLFHPGRHVKLVYVTHSVVVQQKYAYIVEDEIDLKAKIESIKQNFDAMQFTSGVEKNEDKTPKLYQMSKDWNP